jgi:hypothetical protein
MPLRIPEQHLPALEKICRLSPAAAEQLASALQSAPVDASPDRMAERVAPLAPAMSREDLIDIVSTLYAMYGVREIAGVEPDRFVEDLVAGIRSSELKPLVEEAEAAVRDRFLRLMGNEGLRAFSKSIQLQRDGERTYCDSRILSDMRPVFRDDNVGRPLAGVITHTLKLRYHEGGSHKDFFVVLGRSDLENLQKVLTRAQEKDRQLRALLAETGISDFLI